MYWYLRLGLNTYAPSFVLLFGAIQLLYLFIIKKNETQNILNICSQYMKKIVIYESDEDNILYFSKALIYQFDIFSACVSGLEKATTRKDVDIHLMYAILRHSKEKPRSGWGQPVDKNDIGTSDDIERIHLCRNLICHTDASDGKIDNFNEVVLDLIGVICYY